MELSAVPIETPGACNIVIGQAHFVKTVEDLHEALATYCPTARFGIAFAEASGKCLIRKSGNDEKLVEAAVRQLESVGAGHVFLIFLGEAFPITVLNALQATPEVCGVFCATANPVEVIVAETDLGRAVLGVVDGLPPAGVETAEDERERHQLLRTIGYKL